MKELKVAVIGGGFIGLQHMETIRRIPGLKLVAFADTKLEVAKSVCEKQYIPGCYSDYNELLEKEELDAVHVCTPNFTHYEICKAAIEHGVNVFCEKPMTNTYEEAQELVKLASEKGVVCGVDFNYRQNAMVREMHERVQSEDWGKTFCVRGEYIQDWMMYDTDYNWRCVPALGGESRTIADIGSHCFDTLQYILGKKIVKVYAKMNTVIPQRKKAKTEVKTFEKQSAETEYELIDIHSEDMANVMAEFEDGTNGIVCLSQVSAGYKNALKVCIDGSRYSMTWEQENADKLWVGDRETGKTLLLAGSGLMTGDANNYAPLPAGHSVAWPEAMKNGVSSFYSYIRNGGEKKYTTFEDGAQIVRLVDACLESNKTGKWVDVV